MEMKSGIYLIKSTVNGKEYVGSATDLSKRRGQHFRGLRSGAHHSRYMQRHFNKYGEILDFSILEYCGKDKLIEREQYYMDTRKPKFNLAPVAGSSLGVKHTRESKKNMSDAHKGMGIGEENPFYGKTHSVETRKKMRDVHEGKCGGEQNSFYGKTHSEEWKRKASESRTGKKMGPNTEEARKNKSEAQKQWCKNNPKARIGENSPRAKLMNTDVSEIKRRLKGGDICVDIAAKYNVSPWAIYAIKSGANWAHIEI